MRATEPNPRITMRPWRITLPGGFALGAMIAALPAPGCVRRTVTITTEPPHAHVFLNEQEVGISEVTTDFLWYGDYEVTVRKEGYKTLQTNWPIKPPWYQIVPFDFFAECYGRAGFTTSDSATSCSNQRTSRRTTKCLSEQKDLRAQALEPKR